MEQFNPIGHIENHAHRDPRDAKYFLDTFIVRRSLLPPFTDHDPNTNGLSLVGLRPRTLCDAVVYGIYDTRAANKIRFEILLPFKPKEAGYLGSHEEIVKSMGLDCQTGDLELDGLFAVGDFGSLLLLDGFTSRKLPFLSEELQKTIIRYGINAIIDASGTYLTIPTDAENVPCITPHGTRRFGNILEQIKWNTLSQQIAPELGITRVTDLLRFKSLGLLGLPGQQNEGHL